MTDKGPERMKRLLTFEDKEFYEMEIKVLEKMKSEGNDRCSTTACRDLGVDPYDFRDRWGSLLRKHTPEQIIQDVRRIRPYIGQPIREIALNLDINEASVRSLVRKLIQNHHSRHVRTKDNLAHRLLSTTGCSLEHAKASVPSRLKWRKPQNKQETQANDQDSLYSDSESSVDSAESTTSKRSAESPSPAPAKLPQIPAEAKKGESWYEQLRKMWGGTEAVTHEAKGEVLQIGAQLTVLHELTYGERDISKACSSLAVDETAFRGIWQQLLKLVPAKTLEATIFAILSLTRLGYGISVIAAALLVTPNYVNTVLTNFNLELGPCDNHCYDFTLALATKETPSEAASVQLCNTDLARLMHRRVACKGRTREELREKLRDEELVERVMWLFDRGFRAELVSAVLMLPKCMLQAIGEE